MPITHAAGDGASWHPENVLMIFRKSRLVASCQGRVPLPRWSGRWNEAALSQARAGPSGPGRPGPRWERGRPRAAPCANLPGDVEAQRTRASRSKPLYRYARRAGHTPGSSRRRYGLRLGVEAAQIPRLGVRAYSQVACRPRVFSRVTAIQFSVIG